MKRLFFIVASLVLPGFLLAQSKLMSIDEATTGTGAYSKKPFAIAVERG